MKIINTELSPGMTVLLVILAVLFAAIVVPVLLIAGFCWVVCKAVTGYSPLELYLLRKADRHSRIYEGPFQRGADGDDVDNENGATSDDDTIECEVISARTVEPDDRENP